MYLFIWLHCALVEAGSSLRHAGSFAVAPGLSCPTAHGILVPQPGNKPESPALEGRFLTTDHQGSPNI